MVRAEMENHAKMLNACLRSVCIDIAVNGALDRPIGAYTVINISKSPLTYRVYKADSPVSLLYPCDVADALNLGHWVGDLAQAFRDFQK